MSTLSTILRTVANWCEADRELFEERAAIMEFDGGLRRDIAEGRAFEAVKQIRAERAKLNCEGDFNSSINSGGQIK